MVDFFSIPLLFLRHIGTALLADFRKIMYFAVLFDFNNLSQLPSNLLKVTDMFSPAFLTY
jgi:hypothetical protein